MQSTLIYIGAGNLQLPGIHWARQAGLRVVVTDLNTEAPGIALADGYEQIDGTDVSGIVDLARDIAARGRLAGCYCGSDFGLAAVAAVGEEMGVPAARPGAVHLSLDKVAATRALDAAGVPVPRGGAADDAAGLRQLAETLGYPLFVKPVDSSGSRGVRRVEAPQALDEAFEDARRFSRTVMAEQLITGKHIDVNGLFVDDAFFPCGLLERFFSEPPYSYPIWGHEPCSLDARRQQQVYDVVEAGARVLGIDQGPVKADVIMTTDGPVVLEIAPRFHGDVSTSFVTPLATGSSGPRAWFAHLAGNAFRDYLPRATTGPCAGWMGIFPDQAGTFHGLSGLDQAGRLPGIANIVQLKRPGYRLATVADNLAVMGFIWGEGETPVALQRNLQRARSAIQVEMCA